MLKSSGHALKRSFSGQAFPYRLLLLLAMLAFFTAGCVSSSQAPDPIRQALLGLGQQAAKELTTSPALDGTALRDQTFLLSPPNVDHRLTVDETRVKESLTRGLLGVEDGPQVLDWQPADTPGAGTNQWLVDSRLIAEGPRLQLSDRDLLPYRFELRLRRPGDGAALWSTVINGAFDADAL